MCLNTRSLILIILLFAIPITLLSQKEKLLGIQQGSKIINLSIEFGHDRKGESLKSIGSRGTFEHYHRDGFSTAIETTLKYYWGRRKNEYNSTAAFGLGYLVKYHFIAKEYISFFIDCGFGAIISNNAFPVNGTNLNAQYYGGIGSNVSVLNEKQIQYGIRLFHSSNGQGIVDSNPALDSFNFYVSISL